jgi:hypothetical protein
LQDAITLLLGIAVLVGVGAAFNAGGWPYLLSWVGVAVAVLLLLWLLWRLFRAPIMLFVDEGIVGRWRWFQERVLTPMMYGRKGKQG